MEDTTHRRVDIHKAAGILLKNRRFLIEHSTGKPMWLNPGGKVQSGETVKQALVRESKEEFTIDVDEADLEEFGTFYDLAAGHDDKWLRMDVFMVNKWRGEVQPDHEVEQIKWVTSRLAPAVRTGSILEHEIIPRLVARDLID